MATLTPTRLAKPKRLPTVWTADLKTQDSKESFTDLVLGNHSNLVLVKLKKIISDKREALLKKETSVETYSNPNWSHEQAHSNGQREAYEQVLKLLEFVA